MFEITNQVFAEFVIKSRNWSDLARRCGLFETPGNRIDHGKIKLLKQKTLNLGLDTTHFQKFGPKRVRTIGNAKIPNAELFCINRKCHGRILMKRLLELGWKYICNSCKNAHFVQCDDKITWIDKEITLQLEHRNGNHNDNRLENLEFLCCNCHSQTETYTGRNNGKKYEAIVISDDLLRTYVHESRGWIPIVNKLGCTNHINRHIFELKRRAAFLGLDTSHFTKSSKKMNIEDIFVENNNRDCRILKQGLIDMKYKYECNTCKNIHFTEHEGILKWIDKELVLQIEHRNGDHTDNRLENLEFICANCHSQTSTYTAKNMKKFLAKRAWMQDNTPVSACNSVVVSRCVRPKTCDISI
jgi:5-methylcytosine-specific restriction endonuclease McrA